MNELVRQLVMAAILHWRAVAESDYADAWSIGRHREEWARGLGDDIRSANRALNQLRYGWVDQTKVWS